MFFFFKQKTAYEMRISDWSSDVCSSDLSAEKNFDYGAIVRPAQTWHRDNAAAFCKVREEHGALSNMSNDHPYTDQGLRWKSSEAQYQAMRYPAHPDVQEMIRAAPNAYAAKLVAYEHLDKTRADWQEDRKSTRLNSSH